MCQILGIYFSYLIKDITLVMEMQVIFFAEGNV